jgi:hypothetical protein
MRLRRRIGVTTLGILGFELLQLTKKTVVLGVGNERCIHAA